MCPPTKIIRVDAPRTIVSLELHHYTMDSVWAKHYTNPMHRDSLTRKIHRTLVKIGTLKNWVGIVLPETHFPYQREMIARLRNGLSFHLKNSSSDLPILFHIFWDEEYRGLKELPKEIPSNILDIGGHVGMFASYAAHKLPHARIYSYEPETTNVDLFKENIRANGFQDRVILSAYATCKSVGKRKFFVNPENTSMQNLYFAKESRGMKDSITVSCTTLSDIFSTHNIDRFDFAKIDCEGAEYEILLTLPDAFFEKLPRMVIEWHTHASHTPEELVGFLEKKGYSVTYSRKPRLITATRKED